MFWYGSRGGEREGLRMLRWLVGSETEGIGFFSVGFRRYICSEVKNDEKNSHPPTYRRSYEGRSGIWQRIKYLYLEGGSFAAGMRF